MKRGSQYLFFVLIFIVFEASAQTAKPNIILIMADDIGWEAFETYGGEDYKTPNL